MEVNRFSNDIFIEKRRIPAIYQSWLNNLITSQPEFILVAEDHSNIIGFIACTPGIELYDKFVIGGFKPGFIGLYGVKNEYRGKNIGKLLLRDATQLLTMNGCEVIYGNTDFQNISSLKAFQHTGFEVFSGLADFRIWLGNCQK